MALILSFCLNVNLALQAHNQPALKSDKATFDHSKHLKPLVGNVGAFKPLEGGVKLSRTLPATPPNLHKGAIFNKANLPKTVVVNGWYWIPSWLAGEWHRETVTTIAKNGRENTYTERADHLWGHQADRFGNIWHHHSEPYTQIVEQDNSTCSKTITLLEPVNISGSQVSVRYKDISVLYGNFNNTIRQTYQHEQVSRLSRHGDQLFEEVWAKDYDQNGKCFSSNYSVTLYTLIHPFRPAKYDKTGQDLEKNFKLFLSSHKLFKRIPIDLTKSKSD